MPETITTAEAVEIEKKEEMLPEKIDKKAVKKAKKEAKKAEKLKYRDRWRRVRGIAPMTRIVPYIMENRCGSQNFIFDKIDMDRIDKYIKKKRDEEGLKHFDLMHVILAAYTRTVSQRPAINRFIRGQKIYKREKIEYALVVKKEMLLESPDTVVKFLIDPGATVYDVYNELNSTIEKYREVETSGFDKTAKILNFIPGVLLRFTVRLLRFIDYLGLLPRGLAKVSPFHCSFFITSMGSLGIPPVVHHLYDFGTCPVFCAFGAKQREYRVNADGEVKKHSYVDVTYNLDERICDGFYYASAMKLMRNIFKNPEILDTPPKEVIKDIR